MPLDVENCLKNNIHNRSENDIRKIIDELKSNPVPSPHVLLKCEMLYNNTDAGDVEDISDIEEEKADSFEELSDDDDANNQQGNDEAGDDFESGSDDEALNEVRVLKLNLIVVVYFVTYLV